MKTREIVSKCMAHIKHLLVFLLWGCCALALLSAAFELTLPDRANPLPTHNTAIDQHVAITPRSHPTDEPTSAPTDPAQSVSDDLENLEQTYERNNKVANELQSLGVLKSIISTDMFEKSDGSFSVTLEIYVQEYAINLAIAKEVLRLVSEALAPATVTNLNLTINDGLSVTGSYYRRNHWHPAQLPNILTATITETLPITVNATITNTPQPTKIR